MHAHAWVKRSLVYVRLTRMCTPMHSLLHAHPRSSTRAHPRPRTHKRRMLRLRRSGGRPCSPATQQQAWGCMMRCVRWALPLMWTCVLSCCREAGPEGCSTMGHTPTARVPCTPHSTHGLVQGLRPRTAAHPISRPKGAWLPPHCTCAGPDGGRSSARAGIPSCHGPPGPAAGCAGGGCGGGRGAGAAVASSSGRGGRGGSRRLPLSTYRLSSF